MTEELRYLLGELRDDEQDLILTLTEDFLRCTYFDYPFLMAKALKQIDKNLMDDCKQIILLPLISPKDLSKGKNKSSNFLYPIQHKVIPEDSYLRQYKNKVIAISNINSLNLVHGKRQDCLLLFYDDFIGSGQTASEALWDYWINYRVETDFIVVVTLVAQFRGLSLLSRHFFNVYASHVRKRGISDSEKITDVDKALSIMDRIENNLRISKRYRRGYSKSEALVSMIRTPNNTFPAYWWNRTREGTTLPAPFDR
jgi:hypothetical protein